MGLWDIITGAGKTGDVIDAGLDAGKTVLKGLDAMVYTSEEKAIDKAKEVTKNMEHVIALSKMAQSESGASAITRRIVALVVLGNFTIFAQTALVSFLLGHEKIVEGIVKLAKAIMIGELALTVVVSIFGYYSFTKKNK